MPLPGKYNFSYILITTTFHYSLPSLSSHLTTPCFHYHLSLPPHFITTSPNYCFRFICKEIVRFLEQFPQSIEHHHITYSLFKLLDRSKRVGIISTIVRSTHFLRPKCSTHQFSPYFFKSIRMIILPQRIILLVLQT